MRTNKTNVYFLLTPSFRYAVFFDFDEANEWLRKQDMEELSREWNDRHAAATYTYEKENFVLVLVKSNDVSPISMAGLLVHEAVHVFQKILDLMDESGRSGREIEAYSIQKISQNFMEEYVRLGQIK